MLIGFLVIFILFFLFRGFVKIRQTSLITTTGYPLINGYKYITYGSEFKDGNHRLIRETGEELDDIKLGSHLEHLYFDDRYILGEVIKWRNHFDDQREVSYFILDTVAERHISNMSKAEFETALKQLGIWNKVQLYSRDDANWLKQQKH